MGVAYNPKIVTDGLVLALDAANPKSYPGTGTTWSDLSGLGNDGTLQNGVTYSTDNKGTMIFDGVNDYVNIGNKLAYLTSLTLDCWVYFTQQSSNYNGIISKTLDNTDGYELRTLTYTSTTTNIQFRYKGDNAGTGVITCDNNKWLNIVATGKFGAQYVYINGVQVASAATQATPSPNTRDLVIGKLAYSTLYMAGRISNVKIYNRDLSAQEIKQNFNATRGRYGI